MDEIVLMPHWERILKYMQMQEDEKHQELVFSGMSLSHELEIKQIFPSLTALINRGLIEKDKPIVCKVTNGKGVEVEREYQTYKLTEFGRNFIIA